MLLVIKFNDLSQSYLFDLIELHAIKYYKRISQQDELLGNIS